MNRHVTTSLCAVVLLGWAHAPETLAQDEGLLDPIAPGTIEVRLETVADGLSAPNWGIAPPGNTTTLFVTDQNGIIWAIDLSSGERREFLDLSDRLVELGAFGPESFDERGLLGLAFHPDYAANGLLYTYTSEAADGPADFSTLPDGAADHHSVIAEWRVPEPAAADAVVDPDSVRVLLRLDQPQFNHNAGALNFGPKDGWLYIAVGDGGGADDLDGQEFLGTAMVGHGTTGNGQDLTNPFGAVLRIDPLGTDSANGQYGIPAANPFLGAVPPEYVGEIYAYGLRNPFRFSFDMETAELYLADVGQNDIEEINLITGGGNFGWNLKEGTFLFDPRGDLDGMAGPASPGQPDFVIDPIAEYDHRDGLAVIGGFVYRGQDVPELQGRYVFGEFARTFNNDGRLFYLEADHSIKELMLQDREVLGLSLLGFGQDAHGEIYVLANGTGTPFGNTGVVLRIAAAQRTCAEDAECADGVFCNGAERCVDGSCVAGAMPCDESATCDEQSDTCVPDPGFPPDLCGVLAGSCAPTAGMLAMLLAALTGLKARRCSTLGRRVTMPPESHDEQADRQATAGRHPAATNRRMELADPARTRTGGR